MFFNHSNQIVNIDYRTRQLAAEQGIKIKQTTLQSTINNAKKSIPLFASKKTKQKAFESKLLKLLIDECL